MYNMTFEELESKNEKDLAALHGVNRGYLNDEGLAALEALKAIDRAITFASTKEDVKESLLALLSGKDSFHEIKSELAKKNIRLYIKTYLK